MPHGVLVVYRMVSVPMVTPVTLPPADMDAWVLATDQVPPVTASVNNEVRPVQRNVEPEIVPAYGVVSTVKIAVAVAVPQRLVYEYFIVSRPAATPETRPPVPMVATLGLLTLQAPPNVESANNVVDK